MLFYVDRIPIFAYAITQEFNDLHLEYTKQTTTKHVSGMQVKIYTTRLSTFCNMFKFNRPKTSYNEDR